jgi:PAS domain S-box-containing protein
VKTATPASTPSTTQPHGRLTAKVFLIFGLFFVLFVAACSAALWYRHGEALNTAQRRADNLDLILTAHFRSSVDAIDATLTQLALQAQRLPATQPPAEAWTAVLAAALSGLPGLGSLTVVDASGTITASTIPQLLGQSRADLFLFKRLANEPDSGLVADAPFKGLVRGLLLVPLGRRLQTADGRFAGAIVATLEPDRLRGFYRSVNVGPNGIISVMHPTGVLLFREPSPHDPTGQVAQDDLLRQAQRAGPDRGILMGPIEPGGARYISAYRRLAAPPVVIAVSLAEADVLAVWRGEVRTVSLVTGGMGLALAFATFLIGRAFRGRAAAEVQLIDANATLQASEATARAIVETSLDAFVQMDARGTVTEWNQRAEAIFGWSRAGAIGKNLASLIVPERHRAAHATGIERYLRGGEELLPGRRFEIEAQRRDGTEVKVELSVTALRRRGGVVFNGFVRDLTEKLAAEEQIRQAQKMEAVGQLTGGVAHDFNNMLTVITGTIDILAEGVADRPQLATITRLIGEAANRGAELTRQLLAFSRKQPLQPRETNVNALIVESAKLLRATLGEQIEIESMLEEEAWGALVDPGQLSSALLNLALNARDAMPGGGKLRIETANVALGESEVRINRDVQPGQYVMIAVSDTGAGIPEAIRHRVFEPFFSTKTPGKGTGLGLSMVYGFVKQSGGQIRIESEDGRGTTFRIYLPQAPGARVAPYVEAAPTALIDGRNEIILVVEDDDLVRNYVTAQLQTLGYRTIAAANATEALTLVDMGAAFDLLFTDVIMPGTMNGRALAEAVAKRLGAVKVLFTSGYTEDAIMHHGRLDPGVLLLTKPYRKSDLARMIRLALDTDAAAPAGDAAAGPASVRITRTG